MRSTPQQQNPIPRKEAKHHKSPVHQLKRPTTTAFPPPTRHAKELVQARGQATEQELDQEETRPESTLA